MSSPHCYSMNKHKGANTKTAPVADNSVNGENMLKPNGTTLSNGKLVPTILGSTGRHKPDVPASGTGSLPTVELGLNQSNPIQPPPPTNSTRERTSSEDCALAQRKTEMEANVLDSLATPVNVGGHGLLGDPRKNDPELKQTSHENSGKLSQKETPAGKPKPPPGNPPAQVKPRPTKNRFPLPSTPNSGIPKPKERHLNKKSIGTPANSISNNPFAPLADGSNSTIGSSQDFQEAEEKDRKY